MVLFKVMQPNGNEASPYSELLRESVHNPLCLRPPHDPIALVVEKGRSHVHVVRRVGGERWGGRLTGYRGWFPGGEVLVREDYIF